MNYLFLGDDALTKNQKIIELKEKHLNASSSLFDYEVLHAQKLDPDDLIKALLALPAASPSRFVLIRQGHKLTERHLEILLEFWQKDSPQAAVVLDSDELELKSSLLNAVKPFVKIFKFSRQEPLKVFAVTDALSARNTTAALQNLYLLFAQDVHPLYIMGPLVWFWGRQRSRISSERFRQGLRALQNADGNIKRSRMEPEHAVEKVVVELGELLGK